MAQQARTCTNADEFSEERLRGRLTEDLDAGFTEVLEAYERLVYTVALRVSGPEVDAEDLAAEALLRAYRALRGYDEPRIAGLRVRPWLLAIVRNAARNAARDAARRPGPPPALGEEPEPVSPEPGVAQRVEQDETQRQLGAVLAQLPEVQRSAVVLRHVVGLPTSEIAEVLGCAEGTAKSHISRGLARLRTLLADHPVLAAERKNP
jgi:RNA polymerase sigma-70 factor (ECF subfamily)